MKKLIIAAAALIFTSAAHAADTFKMTGVMAVYPGTVNQPFSAPIVNDKAYESKELCEAAIRQIASAHPIIVMINNGVVLPPEKTAGGYVAVAASCN